MHYLQKNVLKISMPRAEKAKLAPPSNNYENHKIIKPKAR